MRYFHILSQVFRFRPPCKAKSSLFLGPAEKLRFLGYSGWKTIGFFQIALPGKATLVPDPGNEGVRDLSGYPSHGWPWLSNKVTWNGLEIPHDLRKPLYIYNTKYSSKTIWSLKSASWEDTHMEKPPDSSALLRYCEAYPKGRFSAKIVLQFWMATKLKYAFILLRKKNTRIFPVKNLWLICLVARVFETRILPGRSVMIT